MDSMGKSRLLVVNLLIWLAAFAVPSLIEMMPVSHPPKIFPLLFWVYRCALAGLSTYLLYSALKRPGDGVATDE